MRLLACGDNGCDACGDGDTTSGSAASQSDCQAWGDGLVARLPLLPSGVIVLLAGALALIAYLFFSADFSVAPETREQGVSQLGPAAVMPSFSPAAVRPLTALRTIEVRLGPNEEGAVDMPERDPMCSGANCFWAFTWSVREPFPAESAVEIRRVSGMGTVSSLPISNTGEGDAPYFGFISAVNRSSAPILLEVRYVLLGAR